MTPCTNCYGTGKVVGFGCPGFRRTELRCQLCDKKGQISGEVLARAERGRLFRYQRVEASVSLRELARLSGCLP
jgi:hypothetical protein